MRFSPTYLFLIFLKSSKWLCFGKFQVIEQHVFLFPFFLLLIPNSRLPPSFPAKAWRRRYTNLQLWTNQPTEKKKNKKVLGKRLMEVVPPPPPPPPPRLRKVFFFAGNCAACVNNPPKKDWNYRRMPMPLPFPQLCLRCRDADRKKRLLFLVPISRQIRNRNTFSGPIWEYESLA